MEVGPVVDNPEVAYQVDLLGAFADREVSIFGVTGTFKELGDLCPVDLSDARVTLEAKNEFVVKVANEAGLEIDPQYEGLFTQVINQRGMERKFSVAASEKPAGADQEAVVEHTQVDIKDKPSEVIEAQPDNAQARRDISFERIQEQQPLTDLLVLNLLAQEDKLSEINQPSYGPPSAENQPQDPVMENNAGAQHWPREAPSIATVNLVNEAHSTAKEDETLSLTTILPAGSSTEGLSGAILLIEEALPEAPEDLDGGVADIPFNENLPNKNKTKQEDLILAWRTELVEESVDIYDTFTESLSVFMLRFNVLPSVYKENSLDETASLDETTASGSCPLVIASVLEGLRAVNESEKEDVALILRKIVDVVQEMRFLEAASAEVDTIASTKEQLEALCAVLLDTLGIEYDEDMLRQFVIVMQNQEFNPTLHLDKEELELDLSNTGTHEAKYFKRLVTNRLSQASKRLINSLGAFALYNAHSSVLHV